MNSKIVFIFTLCFFFKLKYKCQTDNYVEPDKVVKAGKNLANLYIGLNFNKVYGFGGYSEYGGLSSPPNEGTGDNITNYNISYKPVIGFVYEYMLSNRFSLGVDFWHFSINRSFDRRVESSVPSGPYSFTYISNTYNYTSVKTSATRIFLRPVFHMGIYKNIDPYIFTSFGYRINKLNVETNDPSPINFKFIMPFKIGLKPGFGIRYFFNQYFGINAEFSFANPYFSCGVSGCF